MIAGKIESNTSSKTESYSLSSDSVSLPERDYVENEYFYTGLTELDSLISLVLFIQEQKSISYRPANLVDINGNPLNETATFIELTSDEDYELRYLTIPGGKRLPYLRVKKYLSSKRLAIWYIYSYYDGDERRIDTLGYIPPEEGDTLILAQLRSQYPDPNDPSWDFMMRNVYRFGSGDPLSVDVTIYKVVKGGDDIEIDPVSGKEYVELLGIDADGNGITDPTQILWSDGCIIFPYAKPFLHPSLGADTIPIIYQKLKRNLLSDEGENFRIVIRASSTKMEFYMGFGDMVDSSEVIIVDGTDSLKRGVDYKIDYNTGRVVFTERANLNPDSKIEYTYDMEPLFSFTSRYIAKTNIRSRPFENTDVDLDLAFRASSNPELHPRVGTEPSHISIGKLKFTTEREISMFNNLPFVDPESKSKIRINGTYGFSLPNPATNGKSYLDDMESVKLARGLEISPGLWNYCSQPDDAIQIGDLGKIDWFITRLPKINIFPELPLEQRNQYVYPLVLYFQPNTTISNPYNSWAGIMQAFYTAENFSEKKFLEVWVKGDEGNLFVELGTRMNEDIPRWGRAYAGSDFLIPPNGILDTEDRNGNFELEPGEDTGLDGVALDDDKWIYVRDSLDDGRDDYPDRLNTFQDSLKMHRKEGNRRLDSEDLNRDHTPELKNEYFRYKIDLESAELVANEGLDGWKMYRIPMRDSTYYEKIEDPNFENILYARIWITGVNTTTRISIAEIAIVGTKWKDRGVRFHTSDSLDPSGGKFLITYRNSFEDEDYIPPVEVERQIYGGLTREQSIVFKIDSLKSDRYCLAEYYLELPRASYGKGYDLRLYKSLRFYSQVSSNSNDSIHMFLRLLTDSSNYYQYSHYLTEEGWDTLDVNFQNFFDLKLQNDTVSGEYSLKGNPKLNSIAYLYLGVVNISPGDFTGEVYFNDIILREVNSEMGHDLDLTISSNIGDLFPNLSYNITRKTANYKANLDQLRELGDRERISHNLNIKASTGKFLNGFVDMPISFNLRSSSEIPQYKRNSDIFLPPEERGSESSMSNAQRTTFSFSKPSSSNNWLLKYTLDKIRINGIYSIEQSFFPEQLADTIINKSAGINYRLSLPTISPPILSGGSVSLLPNIYFNADYQYRISNKYKYSVKDSVFDKTTVKPVKEFSPSGGFSYRPIRWININYSFSAKQDLLYGDRYGENVSLSEKITANHNSSQFDFNDINVSYTNSFSQNHSIDYSKTFGDTLDVRSVRQSRTINLTNNLKIQRIIRRLPLISGLSDNISPIRFTSSYTRSASFAYLNSLPDYRFRYGIVTRPAHEFIVQSNPSDGGTIHKDFNLSSGINFGRIRIDVSGNLREEKPDDERLKNSISANKITTISFPNANIQFSNIDDYIPGLKKLIRNSKLNISINMDSSTTKSLIGQEQSSGSAALRITPTLDLKFNNGLGLKVTSGYSSKNQYTDKTYRQKTNSKAYDTRVTGSYSFKPGAKGIALPFFGRVKWTTPINLKASFGLQSNKETALNLSTNKEEIRVDNRNITFSLSGNYDFSNMISGGLSINYRNYLNRKITNDVTTSYGARFDVVLKF